MTPEHQLSPLQSMVNIHHLASTPTAPRDAAASLRSLSADETVAAASAHHHNEPPLTIESDSDEGFDEDWAEEFPLFSKPSGPQFIPQKDALLGSDTSLSSATAPAFAPDLLTIPAKVPPASPPHSSHPKAPQPAFIVPPWVTAFVRPVAAGDIKHAKAKSAVAAGDIKHAKAKSAVQPSPDPVPAAAAAKPVITPPAPISTVPPPPPATQTRPARPADISLGTSSEPNLSAQPIRSAAPPTTSSLDSFQEGLRRIAKTNQSKDLTQLEPGSQRNKDSVLHYFVATNESEEVLDQYLTSIIQVFLDTAAPGAINANTSEDTSALRARFGKFKVPRSGDVGTDLQEYLLAVKANVIDKATRVSSPRMIGHMCTALPYFHRPLARLLAALNQNVVKLETALTMTFLERETIAMLHREFFGLSNTFYDHHMHAFDRSLGVFTSGGTIANITAMWTARNKALRPFDGKDGRRKKGFRGVDKEGLFKGLMAYGYKGAVIMGSALMHYSFKKAADLLGLGDEGLCLIPTDKDFRMRTDILEKRIKQFKAKQYLIVAVVGIAGTTETGSIDNLSRIATITREHGIHFHVDAAWGGPLVFSREHQSKLSGIQWADTITIDGHKQLYTPMGLGLILFRNPLDPSHIRKSASYVIRHDSPDLGKFTLEGSRPAMSLHLHASLHLLGRDGIESLVTRSATLVRQMASRLNTHPRGCFQTLHEPSTNILLYRYIPRRLRHKVAALAPLEPAEDDEISDATRRIQTRQAKEGSMGFVSRTSVAMPDPSFGDTLVRPSGWSTPRSSSSASSPERTAAAVVRSRCQTPNAASKPPQPLGRSVVAGAVVRAAEMRRAEELEEDSDDDDGAASTASSEDEDAVLRAPMPPQRRVDAFRVVIANPLTKWEDVEAVIAEQITIGEAVEEEMAIERPGSEAVPKVNMWSGWPFDM
ncbi:hypothetical protein HDU96_009866 [Phlyctochytrium bullatum]|nr:hypothetical protein HDU96_009866 [Phlyctochytrium bullatum]